MNGLHMMLDNLAMHEGRELFITEEEVVRNATKIAAFLNKDAEFLQELTAELKAAESAPTTFARIAAQRSLQVGRRLL